MPFVDAIFRVMEGTGTTERAAALLREAEDACRVEIRTSLPGRPVEEIPAEDYRELVEKLMNDFLSATHLVLGSYEYSQLHVLLMQNYTYIWGHREWGHTVANWANGVKWLGVETWSYLDFYGGPNDLLIERYNEWSEVVMQVIAAKTSATLKG